MKEECKGEEGKAMVDLLVKWLGKVQTHRNKLNRYSKAIKAAFYLVMLFLSFVGGGFWKCQGILLSADLIIDFVARPVVP